MLQLHDKLSPRLRFWLGFACCPLTTFAAAAILLFMVPLMDRVLNIFPENWSYVALAFFCLSGLVYLVAIPVLSGFGSAFFWCHLPRPPSGEGTAGFWSVVLAWSPVLVFVCAWPLLIFFVLPLLFLPFLIFFALYSAAMKRGVEFWNSNRPRQWMGDFSDMG